jgi:hypothetical protein
VDNACVQLSYETCRSDGAVKEDEADCKAAKTPATSSSSTAPATSSSSAELKYWCLVDNSCVQLPYETCRADGVVKDDEETCKASKSSASTTPSSSSAAPAPSSSSVKASSSSAAPAAAKLLIDSFDDGDAVSNLGDYWYVYTDANDGGESTVGNEPKGKSFVPNLQDGTNEVAGLSKFSLDKGTNKNDPYVALGLDNETVTLDCKDGFEYRYKGPAHNFKVEQLTVEDYGHYFATVAASTSAWKTAKIALADLEQPDWADPVTFRIANVSKFAWEVKKTPTTGTLLIDDFYCLGSQIKAPSGGVDCGSSSSKGGEDGEGGVVYCYTTTCRELASKSACDLANGVVLESCSANIWCLKNKLCAETSIADCKAITGKVYASQETCEATTPLLGMTPAVPQGSPYKLFDLQGNLVRSGFGTASVEGLANGVYMLRSGSESRTLIVR